MKPAISDKSRFRLLPLIFFILLAPGISHSEDLELINRPVNASGLTGLLITTSPFTVPDRTMEVSVAAFSEQSTLPDYSLNELPSISISYGLSSNSELALKGSYFHKTVNNGQKERGAGDLELLYKLNVLPQIETSSFPALAVIIGGMAGTGNEKLELRTVDDWGAKIGLSAGREVLWGDHVIGIHADGVLVVHDLSNTERRDRYGLLNAGLIFPISKYRNLQMILEYNMLTGIDRETVEGGDFSALTYGLRLVSERFNLSIGTQFLRKTAGGFDDTSRLMGMMSLKM